MDRIDVQRLAQARNIGFRIMPLYRLIASTERPDRRAAVLKAEQRIPPNFAVHTLTDDRRRKRCCRSFPAVRKVCSVSA